MNKLEVCRSTKNDETWKYNRTFPSFPKHFVVFNSSFQRSFRFASPAPTGHKEGITWIERFSGFQFTSLRWCWRVCCHKKKFHSLDNNEKPDELSSKLRLSELFPFDERGERKVKGNQTNEIRSWTNERGKGPHREKNFIIVLSIRNTMINGWEWEKFF